MSRWFQFSLRGLLVAVALLSIGLGWFVERARRRGSAIDAIVAAGGTIYYQGGDDQPFLDDLLNQGQYVAHFWPDLMLTPIVVSLGHDVQFDSRIGQLLAEAVPIQTLDICDPAEDHVPNLVYVNDGCVVTFYKADNISDDAIDNLRQKLPDVEIGWVRHGSSMEAN